MKHVDFNFKFKSLNGSDIDNLSVKEEMANIIQTTSSRSPVRSMELARKIYNEGKLEMVSEDIELLRNAILAHPNTYDWVKDQLLKALE